MSHNRAADRTQLIDLNSSDYRPALNALEWALHNARQLGYVVPTNFDIALRLMKGELRVPLMSDSGKAGCFGIISSGRDADAEGSHEIFEFWLERTKRRRANEKAINAVGAFIIELGELGNESAEADTLAA